MALATNGSVGEVHLDGDIQGHDPYEPELTPTGVVPGNFAPATLVVEQSGRVLRISSSTGSDFPNASTSQKGVAQFGTNINDEGSGVFGVADASSLGSPQTPGVVTSADTNHITITSGAVDVGPTVVTDLSSALTFSAAVNHQLSTLVGVGSPTTFTPDASESNIFKLTLTGDATLAKPTNAVVGDEYIIIIDASTGSPNSTLTIDNEYKIHSSPTVPVGITVLTCVMIATDKFYTVLQPDFV
jgi:hypothetical protein